MNRQAPATRTVDLHGPAIERMPPDARAIFIRWLADIALDDALKTLETERVEADDDPPAAGK